MSILASCGTPSVPGPLWRTAVAASLSSLTPVMHLCLTKLTLTCRSIGCALLCSVPHLCFRYCIRRLQVRGPYLPRCSDWRPSPAFSISTLSVHLAPSLHLHAIDCHEYYIYVRSWAHYVLLHHVWRYVLVGARRARDRSGVPSCFIAECVSSGAPRCPSALTEQPCARGCSRHIPARCS